MPVYFIRAGVDGPIKIGYTRYPRRRISNLQTASPVQLRLVAVIEGRRADEAKLHEDLRAYRIRGEWFADCPEVRAAIANGRIRDASAEDSEYDEQLDLFGKLRRRYTLDSDGNHLKNTRDLTRLELRGLIAIREDQIEPDLEHLNALRDTEIALSLVWDVRPELTLGQVMEMYLAEREAA